MTSTKPTFWRADLCRLRICGLWFRAERVMEIDRRRCWAGCQPIGQTPNHHPIRKRTHPRNRDVASKFCVDVVNFRASCAEYSRQRQKSVGLSVVALDFSNRSSSNKRLRLRPWRRRPSQPASDAASHGPANYYHSNKLCSVRLQTIASSYVEFARFLLPHFIRSALRLRLEILPG